MNAFHFGTLKFAKIYLQEVNMLSENDLRELLDYQASASVLSIYLNFQPAEGSLDTYKLRAAC
jgi:hypothetical protein